MPIPKLEITNPEAIELINKIKSGAIFNPILLWLKKNLWYLIALGIIIILIIALIIGKKLSEKAESPVFSPPDIENLTPVVTSVIQSSFSGLKKNIQDLNIDLPDPYVPTFDNNIDLEAPVN